MYNISGIFLTLEVPLSSDDEKTAFLYGRLLLGLLCEESLLEVL